MGTPMTRYGSSRYVARMRAGWPPSTMVLSESGMARSPKSMVFVAYHWAW